MASDDFKHRIVFLPEPKLELLDGRLSVGNGAGNLQLMQDILESWGAEAALPMAPSQMWWQALQHAFRGFDPPDVSKSSPVWQAWTAQLTYSPRLPPAGPMLHGRHAATRQTLSIGLYGIARENRFAESSGRDVVMHLGEDAFTPDLFVVGPESAGRLNDCYLDGAADIAMEILLPGHENYDRQIKRRRYEAGKVGEYWLVDFVKEQVEFLRLWGTEYRRQTPSPDGCYRPAAFPGLAFNPAKLWETKDLLSHGPNPFVLEKSMPPISKRVGKSGVAWADLAFQPLPDLESRPISFDQFVGWAPEAKFERIHGKPWIGGPEGTRNVLGLLLLTEGLSRAVAVLHPSKWIAAIRHEEENATRDSTRREQWWRRTREAATRLREKFGIGRLVVIGDLVRRQPLNLWSNVTLVALDGPTKKDLWPAHSFLYDEFRDEPDIHLQEERHLTGSDREAISAEGVEL
jgi:Uma2 family endonuclease